MVLHLWHIATAIGLGLALCMIAVLPSILRAGRADTIAEGEVG
jgi:hypothetical protein